MAIPRFIRLIGSLPISNQERYEKKIQAFKVNKIWGTGRHKGIKSKNWNISNENCTQNQVKLPHVIWKFLIIWTTFHKDIFESHKGAIISNWTIFQSYEIQQTLYNISCIVYDSLLDATCFWNGIRLYLNSEHNVKFWVQPNETEYSI